jgi:hypothetical protein
MTDERERPGRRARNDEPEDDRADRGLAAGAVLARERGAEEHEPNQRSAHAGELARLRTPSRRAPGEQREEADPACGGGLDERERRELERGDVEHPAADPDEEAGEPAAVDEEDDERVDRPPERELREPHRRLVLGEVAPVERAGRAEREREAAEESGGHPASRSRAANGKYASAARAAIPTRGRSRRRS